MATRRPDTDVVVIGLGAAGGVAVWPLAEAGLKVVGLEAGTWLTRRDFAPDEIRFNVRDWPMAVQKANQEVPTHRANAQARTTRFGSHPMMNAVGGTTLHYWAQSWRLNPWDFKVVSETTKRYGASRIPKNSTVEDWPFGYEELEPYYDKVEWEMGVSGQAGNINGTLDPRGNIFEAPRTRGYPMPPLRGTGFTELMAKTAADLGWHPFPGPAHINSRSFQNRSACMYHGYCNKGGCHVDAKNGTHITTIPRAQETGNLDVVTRAHVTKIEVDDRTGLATGVTYTTDGEEFFQPAKVVLVASYTYENSRLLQLSTSRAYPKGLSNNHGQVGRHYFSHAQGGGVSALFPFDLNNWYGLPAQGTGVDNFGDDNWDHAGVDFIGGGLLWVYSDRRPIAAAGASTWGQAPGWGSAWKAWIKENADRTNGAYLQKTTLPYEQNYLDLDPEVKDPLGLPGDAHHGGLPGERAQDQRLHPGQDGAVVSRRGREGHPARRPRHDGAVDPLLRRDADGRQRRDQRREPLGPVARVPEPRRPRLVGHGHERCAQPDAHAPGARVAHRGVPDAGVEERGEGLRGARCWVLGAGCWVDA